VGIQGARKDIPVSIELRIKVCKLEVQGKGKTMKKSVFFVGACLWVLQVAVCNADLVSWYQFSGNANDSVGSNHGALMGNAAIVTDSIRGQVASFDGNGDYVDCGNDTSLQTSDFSVALWFKSRHWTTLHDNYNGIISKRDDFFTSLDWEIFYDGNHDEIRVMTNNSYAIFQYDNIDPSLNVWHHLAFTKSGTAAKIYIDGALKSTDVTNQAISTNATLRIGTIGLDRLNQAFDGYLDDVRIYNNTLTSQEILQLIPEPITLSLFALGTLIIRKKIK
jgi:hypothetical protein